MPGANVDLKIDRVKIDWLITMIMLAVLKSVFLKHFRVFQWILNASSSNMLYGM